MKINRLLTNLCSHNLKASKEFYTALFEFNIEYDSDWFIHLKSEGSAIELGIILQEHEIVPEQSKLTHNNSVQGAYLTFVVDDVDSLFVQAKSLHFEILQKPEVTFYGQKRMLILAPEGTVCDISSPV